mmetsp:Transcript_34450/g.34074  ORF Transcript_34450/g.34074 Transcript_34450/m.34074 type:complete len:165 (-) Transcript_34450:75-569(-)
MNIIVLIIVYQDSESQIVEAMLNNSIICNTMIVLVISIVNLIFQIKSLWRGKKKIKISAANDQVEIIKDSQNLSHIGNKPPTLDATNPIEIYRLNTRPMSQSQRKSGFFKYKRNSLSSDEIIVIPMFKKDTFLDTKSIIHQPDLSTQNMSAQSMMDSKGNPYRQ